MPCYDPLSKDDDEHARIGMAIACRLLETLESGRVINFHELTPATIAWWVKHKARDARPVSALVCAECRGTGIWQDGPIGHNACGGCNGTGRANEER